MKRLMLNLLAVAAACGCMAVCFALPHYYTRFIDNRLLESAQPRTAVHELPLLAEEGRNMPLAAVLYAQAHLFNATEAWYVNSEPVEDVQLPVQQTQALKDAQILPQDYPIYETGWSRGVTGLVYEFVAQDVVVLRVEPMSEKIVSVGWNTEIAPDGMQLLERYLAYLDIESAQTENVDSIAQSLNVTSVYAPDLQLYVSVSIDTRTEKTYCSVNVTSMSRKQLAEIATLASDGTVKTA